jgi:hypothetical protein
MPDDAPIKFSLTGTGRGGVPLEHINKKKNKEFEPAGRRNDSIFSDGEMSARGAARAQN